MRPCCASSCSASSACCFAGWLTVTLGNITPRGRPHRLHRRFDDVSGLLPNDNVKVSGVTVGKVTGIRVDDGGAALVDFEVDDDVEVPEDSTIVGPVARHVRAAVPLRRTRRPPTCSPPATRTSTSPTTRPAPRPHRRLPPARDPVHGRPGPQPAERGPAGPRGLDRRARAGDPRDRRRRRRPDHDAGQPRRRDRPHARQRLDDPRRVRPARRGHPGAGRLAGVDHRHPGRAATTPSTRPSPRSPTCRTSSARWWRPTRTTCGPRSTPSQSTTTLLAVQHRPARRGARPARPALVVYHRVSRLGQWFNVRAVGVSNDYQTLSTERGAELPPRRNDGSSNAASLFQAPLSQAGGR